MRAVVVYESMYGNTRAVAEAIGEGMRTIHDVVVVPVGKAGPDVLDGAQILVVGGPTHVHGMSRPRSRADGPRLSRHDVHVCAEPESFIVTKENTLEAGEAARARRWGEELAAEAEASLIKG